LRYAVDIGFINESPLRALACGSGASALAVAQFSGAVAQRLLRLAG